MKKIKTLEKIGVVLLVIGGLLFLVDKYLSIPFLNPIMQWRSILLYLGLFLWALGLMQKGK